MVILRLLLLIQSGGGEKPAPSGSFAEKGNRGLAALECCCSSPFLPKLCRCFLLAGGPSPCCPMVATPLVEEIESLALLSSSSSWSWCLRVGITLLPRTLAAFCLEALPTTTLDPLPVPCHHIHFAALWRTITGGVQDPCRHETLPLEFRSFAQRCLTEERSHLPSCACVHCWPPLLAEEAPLPHLSSLLICWCH